MTPRLRFVVDTNVGRLARWLRAMGYDALFPPEQGDNALAYIALHEDRVLVTRDGGFARRRAARLGQMRVAHLIAHDLEGQLRQLIREWRLDLDEGFSRCVRCNALLEAVDRESVAERLPPYVLQTQAEFRQCPCCQRVYWRGTHWANMLAQLGRAAAEEEL